MSCSLIPDLHHFRGSYGAKEVFPLYRIADASVPNIVPGLLDLLASMYERKVTPADLLAYVYGVLAHPVFTSIYSEELESRELRVPITKDPALFEQACKIGEYLLWLHTYGERFVPKDHMRGNVPVGHVRCTKAVPGDTDHYPDTFQYVDATKTLRVGTGEFSPLSRQVFDFEISGLKVVQSWLKYRMRKGAGKKSSPLDDIRPDRWTSQFTTEFLELLWVVEKTIATYPEQDKLLRAVIAGECLGREEMPLVPAVSRNAPTLQTKQKELFRQAKDV